MPIYQPYIVQLRCINLANGLYKINKMSTLETKTIHLPHFKSTNQLEQTRKSKLNRKRNNSSQLSAYNTLNTIPHSPTSDSITLHKTLLETNLPDISSKKSNQKRSSILQMWLDQALDPQQREAGLEQPTLRVEVDKTGPLRTVQKFQIDKKYLKSQNISQEAIDKIYNSLYVYTYGINHTFEDILAITKVNEHAEKKIVNNFWRAFVKLLQGCTSYRTTFQIIEETHLKTIAELKDSYLRREQEWLNEKHELEMEGIRLSKKINEQSYTLNKLVNDYNISEATLQLTDQAFNDQVNLRLKFQEKVNAMFTSYDQIRSKYDKLLNELGLNNQQFAQFRRTEANLKAQLDQTNIRLDQTKKRLQRAEEVISERDQQLAIKRQDIYQIQGQLKKAIDEKDQNQEQVRKIVSKGNNYRILSEQSRAEAHSKTLILAELQKRVSQQDQLITASRQANQSLFSQLEEQQNTVSHLQKLLLQSEANLVDANRIKEQSVNISNELQYENKILLMEKQQLQKDLSLARDEIVMKNSSVQKNTNIIGDLQAVNAKYESLYTIVSTQKKKMEKQMEQAVQISQRFKEQMTGMRMLLESKTIQLDEANVKLQNEREVFRSKIAGLRQEIQTKEQQILDLHNKQLQDQELVKESQKQTQISIKQAEQLRLQILNLESEKSQSGIRIEQIERERINKYTTIRSLEAELQEVKQNLLKQKQTLRQKEGVISSTKDKTEAESFQLRNLLDQYRQHREMKVNYVHPMLLEDCLQQINRMGIQIQSLKARNKQLQLSQTKLLADFTQTSLESEEKGRRIASLATSLKINQTDLASTKQKLMKIEHLMEDKISKSNEVQQINYKKCSVLEKQNQQLLEKNIFLEKKTITDTNTLKEQSQQIKKLKTSNREICDTIRQLTGELQFSKKEIALLQDQKRQGKGSSRSGARTQQVPRKKLSKQQKTETQNQLELISEAQKEEQQKSPQHRPLIQPLPPLPSFLLSPAKPETTDQETQTEKRSVHAYKFETNSENKEHQEQKVGDSEKGLQPVRKHDDGRKVEANQFKRALKITYMRR